MVLAHGSEIDRDHLPAEIATFAQGRERMAPLAVARRHFEREYARRALAAADGDPERAAELLMITPDALERKLAGRSTLPPPAPGGADHSFFSGLRGPIKARARVPQDQGALALADPAAIEEAFAESHAKLRARTSDR